MCIYTYIYVYIYIHMYQWWSICWICSDVYGCMFWIFYVPVQAQASDHQAEAKTTDQNNCARGAPPARMGGKAQAPDNFYQIKLI